MGCPVCGGKQVGKVGVNQYYCWNCFIEYNERNEVFEVAEDGTLMAIEPEVFSDPITQATV
ncbi:hypothetical protein GJ688_12200 [Heliobacillus mobilis]|uniref:Uncharacterized protein n=1 Tax=Heliobacterium mobile TaxID=28064 RepID=A0A6I3SLE1_HELMO|nr:hypothetical protein [Heliobacterium mobile]MTV49734.1 hypothetical protein [Heliobacterium mobile]